MKRNLLTVIFSVVALVSIVSLAAFTFANPNINEDALNETSSSDINEQINEIVEIEEETKPVENTSKEVSSATQQAVQSEKDEATESSFDSEKDEATESSFDKVKTLTVQGKKITANFVERQEMGNPNFHARNVYKTNDGVTLDYDAVTGDLVCMMTNFPSSSSVKDKMTEQQAIKIAEDFIKTHASYLDLKKYTLIECTYSEDFKSYDVDYSWIYDGYITKDNIRVSIAGNGEVYFFYANPYLFDTVEKKSVDEQALLKQLDDLVHNYTNNVIGYKITKRMIDVDKNNDIIMCYAVVIEFEVPRENKEISINEKGEIKVFESEQKTNVFTQGVVFEIKI